jgi:hypothetical protein
MLDEAEAGIGGVKRAATAEQCDVAKFAGDDAVCFKPAGVFACRLCHEVEGPRFGRIELAARTVDLEAGDRRSARWTPTEDILAAAFRMPEYLVTL